MLSVLGVQDGRTDRKADRQMDGHQTDSDMNNDF